MGKKTSALSPKAQNILETLGENIRLARKRRKISATMLAQRAGMTRMTLRSIEQGSPTVSMGAYVNALFSLKLAEDLTQVAKDDVLGRKLQDIEILLGKRARIPSHRVSQEVN